MARKCPRPGAISVSQALPPRALATGMPSTHLPPGPRVPYDVDTHQYETPVLLSSQVILEKRSSPCSPLAGSIAVLLKSLRRTALLARKPSGVGAQSFQRGLEPRPDGHGPGKGAQRNRSAAGFPGRGCGEQGQGNGGVRRDRSTRAPRIPFRTQRTALEIPSCQSPSSL